MHEKQKAIDKFGEKISIAINEWVRAPGNIAKLAAQPWGGAKTIFPEPAPGAPAGAPAGGTPAAPMGTGSVGAKPAAPAAPAAAPAFGAASAPAPAVKPPATAASAPAPAPVESEKAKQMRLDAEAKKAPGKPMFGESFLKPGEADAIKAQEEARNKPPAAAKPPDFSHVPINQQAPGALALQGEMNKKPGIAPTFNPQDMSPAAVSSRAAQAQAKSMDRPSPNDATPTPFSPPGTGPGFKPAPAVVPPGSH